MLFNRRELPELESDLRDNYHQHVLEFLQRHKTELRGRILEAGCGRGIFGKQLLRSFAGAEIVGVDLCEQMVALANDNTPSYRAITGDLEEESLFEKNSLDGIACHGVLHHFPDLTRVVNNFSTWCKPGGVVVFTEPNGNNTVKRFSAMIRKAVEISCGKEFVLKHGWASPNEINHPLGVYKTVFANCGFRLVGMELHTDVAWPRRIRSLFDCRDAVFYAQWKLFPHALFAGMDIMMLFRKPSALKSDV